MNAIDLEESFFSALGENPLDDVIDALETALRRRSSESPGDTAYEVVAQELYDLKKRDYAPVELQ